MPPLALRRAQGLVLRLCDDPIPNVRIDTARALLPVGQQLADNRQQPEKAAILARLQVLLPLPPGASLAALVPGTVGAYPPPPILARLQAALATEDEDPDVRDAARAVVEALG